MPAREPTSRWRLTTLLQCTCLLLAACAYAAVGEAFAAGPYTSATEPRLVKLSPDGDYFLNYDGDERNDEQVGRDWPITMIFYNEATVNKVTTFFERYGYDRGGSVKFEPFRPAGSSRLRSDSDRGRKDPCVNGTDNHYRVYGRNGLFTSGRFSDPRFGDFVVASTHTDFGDGGGPCDAANPRFGYSELVEDRLADAADAQLSVNRDYKRLANSEGSVNPSGGRPIPRVDGTPPDHYWQSDGRATLVLMPSDLPAP